MSIKQSYNISRVKTIAFVKRNSTPSSSPGQIFQKKQSDSEEREEGSTGEKISSELSLDKSEEFQRGKLKSATEVSKMSKFGKAYVSNKESKTS